MYTHTDTHTHRGIDKPIFKLPPQPSNSLSYHQKRIFLHYVNNIFHKQNRDVIAVISPPLRTLKTEGKKSLKIYIHSSRETR